MMMANRRGAIGVQPTASGGSSHALRAYRLWNCALPTIVNSSNKIADQCLEKSGNTGNI